MIFCFRYGLHILPTCAVSDGISTLYIDNCAKQQSGTSIVVSTSRCGVSTKPRGPRFDFWVPHSFLADLRFLCLFRSTSFQHKRDHSPHWRQYSLKARSWVISSRKISYYPSHAPAAERIRDNESKLPKSRFRRIFQKSWRKMR
jgi:hypothetical protein